MIRNKTSTAERKYYLKHLQNFLYILKILIIHYLQQSPTKENAKHMNSLRKMHRFIAKYFFIQSYFTYHETVSLSITSIRLYLIIHINHGNNKHSHKNANTAAKAPNKSFTTLLISIKKVK